MSAVTKRVVILTVGLTTLGTISASAAPRHAVVVAPHIVVHRPLFYDPFWGPWGPYTYGYPYAYNVYPQAGIRTEVTPNGHGGRLRATGFDLQTELGDGATRAWRDERSSAESSAGLRIDASTGSG